MFVVIVNSYIEDEPGTCAAVFGPFEDIETAKKFATRYETEESVNWVKVFLVNSPVS